MVGFTVFLCIDHPVFCIRTLFGTDAIEERDASLFVHRITGVDDMAVHRGVELQFAAQLGMIDDMRTVGLQHVLNDAHGLGVILPFKRR